MQVLERRLPKGRVSDEHYVGKLDRNYKLLLIITHSKHSSDSGILTFSVYHT